MPGQEGGTRMGAYSGLLPLPERSPRHPAFSLLALAPTVPSSWNPSLPLDQLTKPEVSLSGHTWLLRTARHKRSQ